MPLSQDTIIRALSKVKVAEKNKNVVELDLIELLELDKATIKILLKPLDIPEESIKALQADISKQLLSLADVERVEFAQQPSSPPDSQPKVPRNTLYLKNYNKVILIGSGKGGVGKSTLSLNLALALKKLGKSVALFDADVYGPSIPFMMGLDSHQAKVIDNKLMPMSKFGIEFMSIGSVVDPKNAVIWRGPLVHQAIEQLMRDTAFSGGDYMLIDLPPGTGDAQITISQITPAYGALIVCTPQDVALLDAQKAISMFKAVNIPLLGMVENMSGFVCPHCQQRTDLFGYGGTEKYSADLGLKFLGRVPIDIVIRQGSDSGEPVVNSQTGSLASKFFIDIASQLIAL